MHHQIAFFWHEKIIIIIKCALLLQLPGLLNLKVNWARELCLRCKFYWASGWDKRYDLYRQLKSFSLCSVLFQDQAQVVVVEEVVVVVVGGTSYVIHNGFSHKVFGLTTTTTTIKLYLRYHFIKNALPVSRLHNKIFRETTLMLKYIYILRKSIL